MGILVNSEDPDEMQHNAGFHQGQHCLLWLKQPSGTGIQHNLENSTCDPLKYKMGNPILIVSMYMGENPSQYKGLSSINYEHKSSMNEFVSKKYLYEINKIHNIELEIRYLQKILIKL